MSEEDLAWLNDLGIRAAEHRADPGWMVAERWCEDAGHWYACYRRMCRALGVAIGLAALEAGALVLVAWAWLNQS